MWGDVLKTSADISPLMMVSLHAANLEWLQWLQWLYSWLIVYHSTLHILLGLCRHRKEGTLDPKVFKELTWESPNQNISDKTILLIPQTMWALSNLFRSINKPTTGWCIGHSSSQLWCSWWTHETWEPKLQYAHGTWGEVEHWMLPIQTCNSCVSVCVGLRPQACMALLCCTGKNEKEVEQQSGISTRHSDTGPHCGTLQWLQYGCKSSPSKSLFEVPCFCSTWHCPNFVPTNFLALPQVLRWIGLGREVTGPKHSATL